MSPLPYYEKACNENQPGSIFAHWNWSAFLFGPLWFAYRKSYFYAFLFLYVEILYGAFLVELGSGFFQYKLTALLPLRILIGFVGTSLYLRKWINGRRSHAKHTSIIALILFSIFNAMFSNALLEKPVFPDVTWPLKREFYYYYYDDRTNGTISIESEKTMKKVKESPYFEV